ncbi:hypothetical protein [Phenylobacterium sp.]|uniref:hypothetical protein n=1 Tax=Phenylobacterium sp. TaxID=1871053 RepID=UPI002DE60A74|nr:hypothetical protein [Phenylobacterium sp.]
MRWRMRTVAALAVLSAAGGMAQAADAPWRTVTLADGTVIDVPAVSATILPKTLGPPRGVSSLMSWGAATAREKLACSLARMAYPADKPYAAVSTLFASQTPDVFCPSPQPGQTEFAIVRSGPLRVQGMAARTCAAVYRDPGDLMPGHVNRTLVIAAPGYIYRLECQITAADLATAKDGYYDEFENSVDHIEGSLRLPAHGGAGTGRRK